MGEEVLVEEDCAGLLFKEQVGELVVNATLVICAQEKEQGVHMRRSLGASYDTASMSIDIHKDVPIASQNQ